jgi:hypothetical protein
MSFGKSKSLGTVVWSMRGKTKRDSHSKATWIAKDRAASCKVLVIGDRLTTDILLAHRLQELLPDHSSSGTRNINQVIAILSTTLHETEGFGNTLLRYIERKMLAFALSLRRDGSLYLRDENAVWEGCAIKKDDQSASWRSTLFLRRVFATHRSTETLSNAKLQNEGLPLTKLQTSTSSASATSAIHRPSTVRDKLLGHLPASLRSSLLLTYLLITAVLLNQSLKPLLDVWAPQDPYTFVSHRAKATEWTRHLR